MSFSRSVKKSFHKPYHTKSQRSLDPIYKELTIQNGSRLLGHTVPVQVETTQDEYVKNDKFVDVNYINGLIPIIASHYVIFHFSSQENENKYNDISFLSPYCKYIIKMRELW